MLGVQIRPLRETLLEYDGEVCLLRLKANWKGAAVDFNDQAVHEFMQREITRVHELYYRRKYTCNCFLCLATLFPRCAPCAKWMSRCCGFCCCKQIEAFREDCVKCSQLAANSKRNRIYSSLSRTVLTACLCQTVYQAVGLMDPLINPNLVLPVDFLPPDLLQSPSGGTIKSPQPKVASAGDEEDTSDDEPIASTTPRGTSTHMGWHSIHGMQFHESENESLSTKRDLHAVHDKSHPHHERHKVLAEEGYVSGRSLTADSNAREDSIKAFFDGFPQFDLDVVPLKVRKDGAKFAAENAEDAKKRWMGDMAKQEAKEHMRPQTGAKDLEESTEMQEESPRTVNHHKVVIDLLGPLLQKINVDAADLDGATLAQFTEQITKGIVGTTIAAGMNLGDSHEQRFAESIGAEKERLDKFRAANSHGMGQREPKPGRAKTAEGVAPRGGEGGARP